MSVPNWIVSKSSIRLTLNLGNVNRMHSHGYSRLCCSCGGRSVTHDLNIPESQWQWEFFCQVELSEASIFNRTASTPNESGQCKPMCDMVSRVKCICERLCGCFDLWPCHSAVAVRCAALFVFRAQLTRLSPKTSPKCMERKYTTRTHTHTGIRWLFSLYRMGHIPFVARFAKCKMENSEWDSFCAI